MSVRHGDLKGDLLALMGALEREGTASNGGAAILYDAGVLTDQDDFFIGKRVYIHDGIAQGDEREITDSDSVNASITVSPNFSATPDATSEYYIYDTYRMATIERALKVALRLIRHRFLLREEDEAADLGDPALAASYEISVPTGLVSIREIWREHDTIDDLYPYFWSGPGDSDIPVWTVHGESAGRKIKIDKARVDANGQFVQGRALRVIGQKYQAEPTDDDSTFTMNTGPLLVLAAAILRLQQLNRVEEIDSTRAALERALDNIGLGWTYEQGAVIVEEA